MKQMSYKSSKNTTRLDEALIDITIVCYDVAKTIIYSKPVHDASKSVRCYETYSYSCINNQCTCAIRTCSSRARITYRMLGPALSVDPNSYRITRKDARDEHVRFAH